MNYMELIINLFINLFLTAMLYETVPLILKYFMKKRYSEKEAKKTAAINTICVYTLITIYYIIFLDEVKLANPAIALLWWSVACNILKTSKKIDKDKKAETFVKHSYSLTPGTEITGDDIAVKDMLKQTRTTSSIESMKLEKNRIAKHAKVNESKLSALENGWKISTFILVIITILMMLLLIKFSIDLESSNQEITNLNHTISFYKNKYKSSLEKIQELSEESSWEKFKKEKEQNINK